MLEFNCRLGDPETQALLVRMQSDLLHVLDAAVMGKLSATELKWKKDAACCIVACSAGYPGELDDGKVIHGLFPEEENLIVFQAGTAFSEGNDSEIVSNGGRLLAVSALCNRLGGEVKRAYEGMSRIKFEGMNYRKDIGGGI